MGNHIHSIKYSLFADLDNKKVFICNQAKEKELTDQYYKLTNIKLKEIIKEIKIS